MTKTGNAVPKKTTSGSVANSCSDSDQLVKPENEEAFRGSGGVLLVASDVFFP
jgi:hypothetical protein